MKIEYLEKYKYPTSVMLNITDDCNLACRYCFVQQKPHYMSLDTAKDIIDFLENNYNIKKENNWLFADEKILITFFGGEPTLLFDSIIAPIIEYIQKEKNKDIFRYAMTTNCTLLNEQRIQFLKNNNFGLLWSIDGDRETQNHNRPCKVQKDFTSFDLVVKNIPTMIKHFPNVAFRSTVYKDTVHLLYHNYLFAKKMGFKKYCAMPDTRSKNWDEESLKILEEQINLICLDQIKEILSDNKEFMEFDNLFKFLKEIPKSDLHTKYISSENVYKIKNNIFRCGLGTSGVSINYNGEIFSCQEQDSREFGDYFHIGDIYNGIDVQKHESLLTEFANAEIKCEKESYCQECYLINICNKGCPSTQHDMFNDMGTLAYTRCLFDNLIMTNALILLKVLSVYDNCKLEDLFNKSVRSYLPEVISLIGKETGNEL